jgi:hypothetical protein
MRLIERKNQMRRDFTGVYKCESCGHVEERGGYDDSYFHEHVIPGMICGGCQMSSKSLGRELILTKPKYADHVII